MPSIEPQSTNGQENVDSENQEQKPPSLTDHLNKKLLSSFLTRINSDNSNFNPMFHNISDSTMNGNENNEFDS